MDTDNGDTPLPQTRTLLLAPPWHTILVYGFFFTLGGSPRTLVNLIKPLFTVLPKNLSTAYLVVIAIQWLLFGFVRWGLTLTHHRLVDILGEKWQRWKEIHVDILLGIGCGILLFVMAAIVFQFAPTSAKIDTKPMTPNEAALSIAEVLCAGYVEEVIFRGYFLRQVAAYSGNVAVGFFVQAVLFSLAHGFNQSWPEIINKFLFGAVLGWVAIERKSLLPSMIAHCGLNLSVALFAVLQ
jgi:membrane protease YdiL (CAAX protease family)